MGGVGWGGAGVGTCLMTIHASHRGHDDGRTLAGIHESITGLSGGDYEERLVNMLLIPEV